METFLVPAAGDGDLCHVSVDHARARQAAIRHTGEDGRLDQLHELVNLDEHIDRHVKFSTVGTVSSRRESGRGKMPTRFEVDCKPARRLEQADTVRMSPPHCNTTTGKVRRRAFVRPVFMISIEADYV